MGGELALGNHDSCADFTEDARIVALMIVGRSSPRDDDRRHADRCKLRDGARASPGDHQIGGRVHLHHLVLVADHAVHDARCATAFGGSVAEKAVTDHVPHGDVVAVAELFHHARHRVVQNLGSK